MIISPTPGRIVWYHEKAIQPDPKQPLAAMVTYVWSDRLVNLVVFNANAMKFERTSVPLVQHNDPTPNDRYAEWMPYQKGQAAKNA